MGKKVDLKGEWTKTRITIFLTATGYAVTVIAILGVSGYYLDHYLGTFPKIFILSLVVGYPFTQFLLYRKFKQTKKK